MGLTVYCIYNMHLLKSEKYSVLQQCQKRVSNAVRCLEYHSLEIRVFNERIWLETMVVE